MLKPIRKTNTTNPYAFPLHHPRFALAATLFALAVCWWLQSKALDRQISELKNGARAVGVTLIFASPTK